MRPCHAVRQKPVALQGMKQCHIEQFASAMLTAMLSSYQEVHMCRELTVLVRHHEGSWLPLATHQLRAANSASAVAAGASSLSLDHSSNLIMSNGSQILSLSPCLRAAVSDHHSPAFPPLDDVTSPMLSNTTSNASVLMPGNVPCSRTICMQGQIRRSQAFILTF